MALGLGASNIAKGDTWDPKEGKRTGQNWWTNTLDTLNPFASTEDIDAAAKKNYVEGVEERFSGELSRLGGVKGVDLSVDSSTTVKDLSNRLQNAARIKAARDGYVQLTGDRSAVEGITDPSQIEALTFKKGEEKVDAKEQKAHQRTIDAEGRSNSEWAKRYEMQRQDQAQQTALANQREDRKDLRMLKAQLADREAARADRKEARAQDYRMRQEELDAKIFSTELNHMQAMQSEKNRMEDRKMQAQAMIMKALGSIGQAFAI